MIDLSTCKKITVPCIDEVLTAQREFSILELTDVDAATLKKGFCDSLSEAASSRAITKAFFIKEGI